MSDVQIPKGKVFLTGGSGHVGANVLRALLDDGQEVRVLVEPGGAREAFEGLDVELVEGDLRDAEAMRRVTKGVARVFHVAAKVSTLNPGAGEQRDLYDINVIGTRNVLRAALENGVARAVLTGSFSATGFNPDDPSLPSDETMPFYPFGRVMPYARTKQLAEHEMLKCVVDGLDAVIATSCACVGPNDFMPSRMGRTMIDYAHGRLRAYIDGGFDFVSFKDIAAGHLLAMEKGRTGHKYIFSTHFHTLQDLVDMFSDTMGTPPVRLKLPAAVMAGLTGVYSGALSKVFPKMPQRLTPGAIGVLRMRRHANTTKAREELGYQPGTVADAVREAYADLYRRGLIPNAPAKGPQDVETSVPRPVEPVAEPAAE